MFRCALLLGSFLSVAALSATPARAEVLIGVAAPLTGGRAWIGAGAQEGANAAVADANAKDGVLGQRLKMISVDDYCAGDQSIAAARKLVASAVVAVFGHPCSGAAIPAAAVYAEVGILMISNLATNPRLTEQGFANVFRVVGRDDVQGRIAGDFLVERFGKGRLAILHDGETYGRGLAEETKKRLNELGITEVIFKAIEPGKADYLDVVLELRALDVEVLYYGGYPSEAALILRQARERRYELQLVGGDGIGNKVFALIAGPAADGALLTLPPLPSASRATAALAKVLVAVDVGPLNAFVMYAAIQVWTQAAEKAGTFATEAVAEVLRTHEFDTVLGRIGFDAKGDVTGYDTFAWYVWKGDTYVPLDPVAGE
jgi:branched-chain amino acid transport system substrate-binding protein